MENALLEHPAVQERAVVGAPDPARGEIVKAFVVLREGWEGTPALVAALQEHTKAVTAPYKYPRAVEFMDDFPRTATGKVRRRTLKDFELERTRTVASCHASGGCRCRSTSTSTPSAPSRRTG